MFFLDVKQNRKHKTQPSKTAYLYSLAKWQDRDVRGTRWVVNQRWDVKSQLILLSRMALEG